MPYPPAEARARAARAGKRDTSSKQGKGFIEKWREVQILIREPRHESLFAFGNIVKKVVPYCRVTSNQD
jgi:hypothetical protein